MITYLFRLYRYHWKENRIFFLSQSMGIALLQFVEIFINDNSFMEHYAVVSDVLVDMMRLLEIMIILSMVIFLVLAHWYFLRNQAKEFQTFQCAGMSKEETVYLYLAGFLITDVMALAIGMLLGSLLANLCYVFLKTAFGMALKLPFVRLKVIRKTVLLTGLSDAGAGIWMLLFSPVKDKKSRGEESAVYWKTIIIITGIILLTAFFTHWEMDGIAAVLVLIPGILCLDFAVLKWDRMRWKKREAYGVRYVEKVLICEALKKNRGMILTAGAVFSLVLMFASGFFMDIHYWDKDVYSQQNPFDLVIVNYEVMPDLKEKQIAEIVKKADSPVVYSKKIVSMRDGAFNFLSADEVNQILHTHYRVKEGYFIQIFRVYGRYRQEDFLSTESIHKKIKGKTVTMQKQENADNILFGYSRSMADQTILLNQSDYRSLFEAGKEAGVLKQDVYLYRFQDWKKTEGAVRELKRILGDGEAYSTACSKIEGYQHVEEGYLFFTVTIFPILVSMVLFGILQFRFALMLQAEKNEKELYRLACLGIGTDVQSGMKKRLERALYVRPGILAMLNWCYFLLWLWFYF